MKPAIVTLCRALAQVLAAHYASYDVPTSRLLNALADWVKANE